MLTIRTKIEKDGIGANEVLMSDNSSDIATMLKNAVSAGYSEDEVEIVDLSDVELATAIEAQSPVKDRPHTLGQLISLLVEKGVISEKELSAASQSDQIKHG